MVLAQRRKTIGVKVGCVQVGGGAPISVQSVTKTDTDDKLKDYVMKKDPAYAVQIGLPNEATQRVRDVVTLILHGDDETTPASIVTDSSGRILAARWGIPTVSELKQLQAQGGD